MKIQAIAIAILWVILCAGLTAAEKPKKLPDSVLDQTVQQIMEAQGTEQQAVRPGSLWTPTARFSDLTSDLRARRAGSSLRSSTR